MITYGNDLFISTLIANFVPTYSLSESHLGNLLTPKNVLDAVADRYQTYLRTSFSSTPTLGAPNLSTCVTRPTVPINLISELTSAVNSNSRSTVGETILLLPYNGEKNSKPRIKLEKGVHADFCRKRTDIISCEENAARRKLHDDALQDCIPATVLPSITRTCSTSNTHDGSYQTEIVTPLVRKSSNGCRVKLSAKEHFKKRGSMSPLQRCSDIVCMVWPLMLVLSVRCDAINASNINIGQDNAGSRGHSDQHSRVPTSVESSRASSRPYQGTGGDLKNSTSPSVLFDSISSSNIAADKGINPQPSASSTRVFEVTDGWWWTRAVLDPELNRLVERGVLFDGCKIAVFAAQFEMESGSETATCCIKLSVNSVRKGYTFAALGFLYPPSLGRGLSLKSISQGGGPVFAVRVKVLLICPQMVKITTEGLSGGQGQGQKRKTDPQAPTGTTRSSLRGADRESVGGGRAVILNSCEANELRAIVSRRSSLVEDSLEGDRQLSLASMLDYLGCDDWLVEVFSVSQDTYASTSSYSRQAHWVAYISFGAKSESTA